MIHVYMYQTDWKTLEIISCLVNLCDVQLWVCAQNLKAPHPYLILKIHSSFSSQTTPLPHLPPPHPCPPLSIIFPKCNMYVAVYMYGSFTAL